jgi:hypothetical protein
MEEITVETIPAPKKRTPKPTVGQEVLEIIEEGGGQLPQELRTQIVEISDEDGMKAFLKANLSDVVKYDEMEAQSIFGKWLKKKIDLPEMMMVWRFYNLGQAKSGMEIGKELMMKEGLSMDERLAALRLFIESTRAFGTLLDKAQKLALDSLPKPAAPGFKNKPPDILQQTNIAVKVSLNGDDAPKQLN